MIATIECRCGWMTEERVTTRKQAEIAAERHEFQGWRRAYRHDANVTTVKEEK